MQLMTYTEWVNQTSYFIIMSNKNDYYKRYFPEQLYLPIITVQGGYL